MVKLADIKNQFEEYIVIKDPYVLEVILATMIGNLIVPRDPLWTMLVAASSGGKSTMMAPCSGINHVYFIDDMNDKTFLTGMPSPIKGQEISLLNVIKNGILCFSDFTNILAKDVTTRGEILAQFRLVYDGNFVKRTGRGEVKWSGKMGLLAASTPDIYHQLESARSMGERFIYYNITQPTDLEIVQKQEQVKMPASAITAIMKPLFGEYFNNVRDFIYAGDTFPELKMTPEQIVRVHEAAMFCVLGKSSIRTDFKTGKPESIPNKPGVGRDRKMFQTMLHALQLMSAYEAGDKDLPVQDEHIKIIERCAYSSINRERRKCLEILSLSDRPLTTSTIGYTDGFGLGKEAIEKFLYPLAAVGIVQQRRSGKGFEWFIDNEKVRNFIKSVADKLPDKLIDEEQVKVFDELEEWMEK